MTSRHRLLLALAAALLLLSFASAASAQKVDPRNRHGNLTFSISGSWSQTDVRRQDCVVYNGEPSTRYEENVPFTTVETGTFKSGKGSIGWSGIPGGYGPFFGRDAVPTGKVKRAKLSVTETRTETATSNEPCLDPAPGSGCGEKTGTDSVTPEFFATSRYRGSKTGRNTFTPQLSIGSTDISWRPCGGDDLLPGIVRVDEYQAALLRKSLVTVKTFYKKRDFTFKGSDTVKGVKMNLTLKVHRTG